MTNYEQLKSSYMQNSEFVNEYNEAKKQVDLEYEVQSIKDSIANNDTTFNVLDALDLLQKHIVDFTQQQKLA
ncbi:MAG: hypothetical protein GQ570_05920 [Helicobacteraceae bacterium]|nr:hypothetical protein [Helicobacteraceae bacterium]